MLSEIENGLWKNVINDQIQDLPVHLQKYFNINILHGFASHDRRGAFPYAPWGGGINFRPSRVREEGSRYCVNALQRAHAQEGYATLALDLHHWGVEAGVMMGILLMILTLQIPDARPISVPSRVVVDGPRVLLMDLGWPDRILGEVAIMDSPRPGRSKRISRHNILKLLKKNAPGIRFRVPRRVVITRSSHRIGGSDLRHLVRKAIESRLPKGAKIMSLYMGRSSVLLPRGRVRVTVEQDGRTSRVGAWVGRVTVEASGWSESFGVSVRYTLVRPVAVLVRPKRAGEVITESDVEFRPMDVTSLSGAVTRDVFRSGLVARTFMASGRVLNSRLVRKPRIVKRGQRVRMIARIGAVEVSAWGIARNDGAEGDRVVLTNPRTGKIVKGIVVGPGRVLVVKR